MKLYIAEYHWDDGVNPESAYTTLEGAQAFLVALARDIGHVASEWREDTNPNTHEHTWTLQCSTSDRYIVRECEIDFDIQNSEVFALYDCDARELHALYATLAQGMEGRALNYYGIIGEHWSERGVVTDTRWASLSSSNRIFELHRLLVDVTYAQWEDWRLARIANSSHVSNLPDA